MTSIHGLIYDSFSRAGADRLIWRVDSGRLRILCYHGICEDRLANEAWVPSFFVKQSVFERQLRYLQRTARVLPLHEAAARLQEGSLPPRSVSITFDDGYANNLHLASPLLRKYEMHATVFLASAYIESGEFFPFLKLKLIRQGVGADLEGYPLADYKSAPLDLVMQRADRWWPEVERRLTGDQFDTLRPLTVAEVKAADNQWIEFGGHSHTHCILKNERAERRQLEIRTSIRKVRQWTGRPVRLFSYPNGEQGDFGEPDKQALLAENVQAAVTGIGGANDSRVDPLELRRYPLTMGHGDARFRAEVTGFRNALQRATARLGL